MRQGSFIAVSGLAVVLFAAGMAWGDEVKEKGTGTSSPAISLEEAIQAAKTKVPGRVVEAELEDEDGKLVYDVEIENADGETRELEIDATSGQVSMEESEGASDD